MRCALIHKEIYMYLTSHLLIIQRILQNDVIVRALQQSSEVNI